MYSNNTEDKIFRQVKNNQSTIWSLIEKLDQLIT